MTPHEIRAARQFVGLPLSHMAVMLGYKGKYTRQMMHHIETGVKPLREPQRRLLQAYIDGYRPTDWPKDKASVRKSDCHIEYNSR